MPKLTVRTVKAVEATAPIASFGMTSCPVLAFA